MAIWVKPLHEKPNIRARFRSNSCIPQCFDTFDRVLKWDVIKNKSLEIIGFTDISCCHLGMGYWPFHASVAPYKSL